LPALKSFSLSPAALYSGAFRLRAICAYAGKLLAGILPGGGVKRYCVKAGCGRKCAEACSPPRLTGRAVQSGGNEALSLSAGSEFHMAKGKNHLN
jgi:hypothetical protein